MAPQCGLTEASCKCIEPKDHEGPHTCECGGRWDFTKDGEFVPVVMPGNMGFFEIAGVLLGGWD